VKVGSGKESSAVNEVIQKAYVDHIDHVHHIDHVEDRDPTGNWWTTADFENLSPKEKTADEHASKALKKALKELKTASEAYAAAKAKVAKELKAGDKVEIIEADEKNAEEAAEHLEQVALEGEKETAVAVADTDPAEDRYAESIVQDEQDLTQAEYAAIQEAKEKNEAWHKELDAHLAKDAAIRDADATAALSLEAEADNNWKKVQSDLTSADDLQAKIDRVDLEDPSTWTVKNRRRPVA